MGLSVLHLDSGRDMRGGQWQVLRLHRGLVAAGHRSMLMAREGSPLMAAAKQEGLPCTVLSRSLGGYDLVHAHDAHSHTRAVLLARCPIIVSRRVAFPVKTGLVSRWKYRRPALFLAVSRFVAGQLVAAGVPESRITVVYDGVPIPSEPARGNKILIPETSDPAKGMALAEEAARLAGVEVHRSRDLTADLPHASALLYITHSEGLGSGILLAMAHGVPVIASNVGGIPEIESGGLVVLQNEANLIAAALRRLTPAMGAAMGAAGRQTVVDRFSEERMVADTVAAYRKVLCDA